VFFDLGSDYVEMFVGVGASRVRDLFEQAKQAIAVHRLHGRDRRSRPPSRRGLGGGHDEREQTLNQLLVEMDGFEMKDNITSSPPRTAPTSTRRSAPAASTGRSSSTGPTASPPAHPRGTRRASARAGDRPEHVAAGTPGFTGADLASLVSEAALLAARRGRRSSSRRSWRRGSCAWSRPGEEARLLSEHERKITAYHEMATPSSATSSSTPTPSTRSRSSPAARRSGSRSLPTEDRYSRRARR
jgi:cell division protease FtsH